MHDLSPELQSLQLDGTADRARSVAVQIERRELFSIHRELVVMLYAGVATVVAGVGFLVKANLDRIGPVALLSALLLASLCCYFVALRARMKGRERRLGEDYVLLLGALLFSAAVGYGEVQFRLLGAAWSRHLILLAVWHLATAYFFRSRLVLSVALAAFASWMGAELSFGSVFGYSHPLWGAGPRALVCGAIFHVAGLLHLFTNPARDAGFRDVYRQFAMNFAFLGALAMTFEPGMRWVGALTLLGLAVVSARLGLREKRESYLVYAVGYGTIGMIWIEFRLLGDLLMTSTLGLATVIGAVVLLFSLRGRLKESRA